MNNEFWMPAPQGDPAGIVFYGQVLTPAEQAVLRRLRRGERPRLAARRTTGRRERAALRKRRRTLDRLAPGDLRSLVQIVMQLNL